MTLKEFHLPDIGEGIAEGEIVKWLVKEGDRVKAEQPFVEIMTDKATVTITIPKDCVIKELRAKEGQVVPVESVIAVFEIEGGAPAGGGSAPAPAKGKAERPASGAPAAPQKSNAPAPAASKPAAQSTAQPQPGAPPRQTAAATRPAASSQPPARPAAAVPAAKPAARRTEAASEPSETDETRGPDGPQEEPADAEGQAAGAPEARQEAAPRGPATRTAARPAAAPAQPQRDGATVHESVPASPGRVLAAPATRRRARELGVDLTGVAPTGPRGRVTNDDLNTFLAGGAPSRPSADGEQDQDQQQDQLQDAATEQVETEMPSAASVPAADGKAAKPAVTREGASARVGAGAAQPATSAGQKPREERIPFRGLRKKIAEAMTRSKHTAAHFTYVDDMDVTALVKLRNEAKELYKPQGVNVTYLPFIMKAVVEAMRAFPMMNCTLDEKTQELVVKRYYNFGIATDTDNGLIVPVLKNVDQKPIAQLAKEIQELAEKTRSGKVAIEDLREGTFSITNAGNIGGLFATPVINFPEVAILGVHAIKKTPIVRDDKIEIGDVMYLSVSIDHRIVDGATGARWMNVVKQNLESPTKLLLGSL